MSNRNADLINKFAVMAAIISIIRISEQFDHIYATNDVAGRTRTYTILGLLTSLIWGVYMHRTGSAIGLTVMSISVFFELYILKVILTTQKP